MKFSAAPKFRTIFYVLIPLLILLNGISTASAKGKWEQIAKAQGITVFQKEVPGRSLPVFRGVGIVKENIFDVLAVLYDVPARVDWVHQCTASDVLKEYNELDRMVYNRTAAPWPISDRDVVVRTKVHIDRETMTVRVTFKTDTHASAPKVEDVVRMGRLTGYYEIKALSRGHTRVTYEVDADPGGYLPAWLVKMASKDLPLKTILNLKKRVKKDRLNKSYEAFHKRWRIPENENYPEDAKADQTRKTSKLETAAPNSAAD